MNSSGDTAPRVLIVDDQPAVVQALTLLLDLNELRSVSASSPDEALAIAAKEPLGAVLQDMNFSRSETDGEEGARLFRALREAQPGLPVLLMTAWASLETAVALVRDGAADYLQKPWDDDKLVATLKNLVRMRQLEVENETLRRELAISRRELSLSHDLCGLVYASQAMHSLVGLALNVAPSDAPLLITGPSGSGKERLAEIVQANSRRRDRPFVRVNLGAIPEELIDSELFGAEPGAYTGAQQRRLGYFETADGGTLFLDEIDSLSPAGQVKLLRVLQSGEFLRLGSSRARTADVRILSASNADLKEELAAGRFREDLYFRLNVVELHLPSLAERREDLLPLAAHFIERYGGEDPGHELSSEAERALLQHDWPGNVRELENRVQRATLVAGDRKIGVADLGLDQPDPGVAAVRSLEPDQVSERQEVVQALAEASGVVARAAERLGLSRQALYRKMTRLGIELERRPKV